MMKTVIVKANPLSRFHFGKPAIDNKTGLADTAEWFSSDSLFSALVNNIAKYSEDNLKLFIDLFKDEKIRISSLFYGLCNNNKNSYFLPKPVNSSAILPPNTPYPNIKKVKKIRFLSQAILETYGENWVNHLTDLVIQGNTAFLKTEYSDDLKKQFEGLFIKGLATHINTRPKPQKNEETNEIETPVNELFQTAYIQFPLYRNWQTFFYFLLEDEQLNQEEQKLLNFAIKLIPFEGIGGKRNEGYGWIDDVTINPECPLIWQTQRNASKSITTGLLIPKTFNDFNQLDAYEITQRGGRKINPTTYLKVVNMITEGAIAKNSGKLTGTFADITPPDTTQSFYRLGSCITLPLKQLNNDEL